MAKWYILHTASGSEKRVKQMIQDQIARQNMSDYFEDIVVPVVEVPEIRRGKKVVVEKKFMPGYVLIKMNMTDESWHLVKSVPKITGFLGSKTNPKPLSEKEVADIFAQLESESQNATSSSLYNVGDKVQVVDGPFDAFSGVVEGVDIEAQKLKISVSIFGKATPIELGFAQVKKG
jgi:transcription termination/antitermination protein NusG